MESDNDLEFRAIPADQHVNFYKNSTKFCMHHGNVHFIFIQVYILPVKIFKVSLYSDSISLRSFFDFNSIGAKKKRKQFVSRKFYEKWSAGFQLFMPLRFKQNL